MCYTGTLVYCGAHVNGCHLRLRRRLHEHLVVEMRGPGNAQVIADLWGVLEAAGISQQRALELAKQNGSITRELGWGEADGGGEREEGGPVAAARPATRVLWGDPTMSPTKRGSKHSLPSALLRLTGKATSAQFEWVKSRPTALPSFTALQAGEETPTELAAAALVHAADEWEESILMPFSPNPLLPAAPKPKHAVPSVAKRRSGVATPVSTAAAAPRATAAGARAPRAVKAAEAAAAALEPETADEEGYGATSASDSEHTPQPTRKTASAATANTGTSLSTQLNGAESGWWPPKRRAWQVGSR
jgi:hypothetical protein